MKKNVGGIDRVLAQYLNGKTAMSSNEQLLEQLAYLM
jgi:hypothetical protein